VEVEAVPAVAGQGRTAILDQASLDTWAPDDLPIAEKRRRRPL
jgi:hypothetical protein